MRFPWQRVKPDAAPAAQTPAAAKAAGPDWARLAARARGQAELKKMPTAPGQLHPPRVAPKELMAQDDGTTADFSAWANSAINTIFAEGQTFLGYPVLAELAQRPEYRRIVETFARHMTRKWIEFQSTGEDELEEAKEKDEEEGAGSEEEGSKAPPFGAEDADVVPFAKKEAAPAPGEESEDDDAEPGPAEEAAQKKLDKKAEKIKEIEAELIRLNAKEVFERVLTQDGFFGRAHLYIDLGTTDDNAELMTSIGDGEDDATKAKLAGKGKGEEHAIVALRPVEAVWCYPTNYNSNDPLRADWYLPSNWFVMGRQIHATRLLRFVGREVPDILKPAYSFGGLALTQMVKPYVDNWLNTRQSVADIVSAFSIMVLKTQLGESLNDAGDALFSRAELFNLLRDNRGLFIVDKNTEDFANVSAPLGSLDKLQAQSQEQMASAAGIPIVLLLMITPSGLNASSEGEIQAFYDWIQAQQEQLVRPNLTTIINMIQISKWGEVDPDITFKFAPLWGLNELEEAQRALAEAQTDAAYVSAGILNVEEPRKRLSDDAASPYHGIDVSDAPEPPMPEGGLFGEEGDEGEEGSPGEKEAA